MALILALDQGTSSSRSIVFDEHGHILASAQLETRQHYPHPGWVEHDPMELWTSQRDTAHAALVQLRTQGRDLSEVYAVGITNQRETTVLWRRDTGQPVGPAIVWQDRRTEAQCARWREQGLADLIRAKTGLVIDPYFSGSKLQWLLDHIDGARAADLVVTFKVGIARDVVADGWAARTACAGAEINADAVAGNDPAPAAVERQVKECRAAFIFAIGNRQGTYAQRILLAGNFDFEPSVLRYAAFIDF